MKKPLVPLDGSDSAQRALAHALAELQGQAGAELHVLQVQAPPLQLLPGGQVPLEVLRQALRSEGEALLAQALAAWPHASVPCVHHVRIGPVAAEIVDCAREQGCDAIVMGTRGLGAALGLVLGSVATRVLQQTGLPVTLLR